MTSLETLDLENNNLGGLEVVVAEDGGTVEVARDGLGEELHTLKRMQCLNLTKNKLRKIPDVVTQFVALRILDLTDNECVPSALWMFGGHTQIPQRRFCWREEYICMSCGTGINFGRFLGNVTSDCCHC